jgi:hypothetical protein
MSRADYDEIKEKFGQFAKGIKEYNENLVLEHVFEQAEVKISTFFQNKNDISVLSDFVLTYPKCDVFQMAIYNYACRIHENEAQQIGYLICESLNYVKGKQEMDVFYYAIMTACHWIKEDQGWKMSEVHMDVFPFYGNLKEYFSKTWYFANNLASDEEGVQLPAIEGEYDSPWLRISEAEDVLSDEEKIAESQAMCFFGMDYLLVDHRLNSYSKKLSTHSSRFGEYEGARAIIAPLRYKRLKDRYWCHPFRFENFRFNEDHTWCKVDVCRVFGWAQRNHEYVWTCENVNTEHMCCDGYFEFVLEDGSWKWAYGVNVLGIYETGDYPKDLYGDRYE